MAKSRANRYPLEFLDLPTSPEQPVAWALNEYAAPTDKHFDVHLGLEIGIVMAGKSRRLYQDYAFVTQPGEVWFAGLWEPHGMQILQGRTRHLVLGVLPEFLGAGDPYAGCDWMQLFRLPPDQRPRAKTAADRRFALEMGQKIMALAQSSDRLRMPRLRLALQELLLHWMDRIPRTSAARPSPAADSSPGDLLLAVRQIERDLGGKITLELGARAARMSRSRFAEEFRIHMGTTFARYVTRRRLAGVMWDLRAGEAKIQVLAERWGFADASHLVRVFRTVTGTTPQAYRTHHRRRIGPGRSYQPLAMPRPDVEHDRP